METASPAHGQAGFRPARKPRTVIADRASIHDRPRDVDSRDVAGHWEGDLLICRRTRPVPVLKERKSRFVIAAKLAGKAAAGTASAIMDVFERLDPSLRKSVTFDNDTAFDMAEGSRRDHERKAPARPARENRYVLLNKVLDMAEGSRRDHERKAPARPARENRYRQNIGRRVAGHRPHAQPHARKCLAYKTPVQALLEQLAIDAKISFSPNDALRA